MDWLAISEAEPNRCVSFLQQVAYVPCKILRMGKTGDETRRAERVSKGQGNLLQVLLGERWQVCGTADDGAEERERHQQHPSLGQLLPVRFCRLHHLLRLIFAARKQHLQAGRP